MVYVVQAQQDPSFAAWVRSIVTEKLTEWQRAFYARERQVGDAIGGKVDAVTDGMFNGCDGADGDGKTPLDEISIPAHHFDAILRLYMQRDRSPDYAKLLAVARRLRGDDPAQRRALLKALMLHFDD